CGPCIATFPYLIEWDKQYKKDGLTILGATTYLGNIGFDKQTGKLKNLEAKQKAEDEDNMLRDFAAYHKLAHCIMTLTEPNWTKATKEFCFAGDMPAALLIDRKGIVRMGRVGGSLDNAEALHAQIKKLLAEK